MFAQQMHFQRSFVLGSFGSFLFANLHTQMGDLIGNNCATKCPLDVYLMGNVPRRTIRALHARWTDVVCVTRAKQLS